MDELIGGAVEARWSAKPAAVGAAGAASVVALGLLWWIPDPAGRLLLGVAAAGLAVTALLGAVLRPRLRANPTGLHVRGPLATVSLSWAEVADVAVVRTRRLGREVPVLEITGRADPAEDGLLLVLTRLDLGTEPDDVLARLRELRSRAT